MPLKAQEELTPNMANGIRNFTVIVDAPANLWILKIVDGFGPHTYNLKKVKNYGKHKVLMLK